jgi:phage N-6-adenine-methyltransferase
VCRAVFASGTTGRPRLYCSDRCRKAAARRRVRTKPYHRTGSDEWATPPEVFDPLHAEFGFTLDVCATHDNTKCARYFTKADDGLAKLWDGVCWMNPPYSEVARWVAKAAEAARGGSTVVALVRSNTDTAWWHEFAPLAELRVVRGRIKFLGSNGSAAPFPSALLIFRPGLRPGLRPAGTVT